MEAIASPSPTEAVVGVEAARDTVAPAVVARHILWLRQDVDTTPMHILKLVYLCHGWMLGIHGPALISEPVEAWQYGPVVPSLYHQYKRFGGGIIVGEQAVAQTGLDPKAADLIQGVESVYRPCTPFQLSALTHQPGTPWDITLRKSGIGAVIPNDLIQEHYRGLRG